MSWVDEAVEAGDAEFRRRIQEEAQKAAEQGAVYTHWMRKYAELTPLVERLLSDVGDACFGRGFFGSAKYYVERRPGNGDSIPQWALIYPRKEVSDSRIQLHVHVFDENGRSDFVFWVSGGGPRVTTADTSESSLRQALQQVVPSFVACYKGLPKDYFKKRARVASDEDYYSGFQRD